MKWFRVTKMVHTNEGVRNVFCGRLLASSYDHAYELAERRYGRNQFDIASVPPFADHTQCGVACNLQPRSFIFGL